MWGGRRRGGRAREWWARAFCVFVSRSALWRDMSSAAITTMSTRTRNDSVIHVDGLPSVSVMTGTICIAPTQRK